MPDTLRRLAPVSTERRARRRDAGQDAGFERSRDYVQSLARGLVVLRSVAGVNTLVCQPFTESIARWM